MMEKPKLSEGVEAAEVEIRAMLQDMHVMGGNDYEPSRIEEILGRLQDGSLSPEAAVEEARKVLDQKITNSYH